MQAGSQPVHRLLDIQPRPGKFFHHGDRLGLEIIAAQHQSRNLTGHPAKQCVTGFDVQLSRPHHLAQQNLDVDLVIGGVNSGGVVDKVGIDPATGLGKLHPAPLGQTQVAALADDLAPQVAAIAPALIHAILGANWRMG